MQRPIPKAPPRGAPPPLHGQLIWHVRHTGWAAVTVTFLILTTALSLVPGQLASVTAAISVMAVTVALIRHPVAVLGSERTIGIRRRATWWSAKRWDLKGLA